MTLINSNVAPGQEVRSQKSVHSDQGFEFGPGSEFNDYNDLLTWPPGQELRIHADAVHSSKSLSSDAPASGLRSACSPPGLGPGKKPRSEFEAGPRPGAQNSDPAADSGASAVYLSVK